jgi:fructoselysine-6-P-deglycase FrlB-like protein
MEAAVPGWRLSRLQVLLEGPLAVVATGGSHALALLWARLHESLGWPAWAMTPADFCARGAPPRTQVLILSASGRHHDILRAAGRADAPFAIVCDRSAPLCDVVRTRGGDALILPAASSRGMGDYRGTLGYLSLLARWHDCARQIAPLFDVTLPTLPKTRPRHVVALGAGLASAAAHDFANRCRESGLATARASDLRDIAHGDLLALDLKHTCLVVFGRAEQATYRDRYLEQLPAGLDRMIVESTRTGACAGIDWMIQSGRLAWALQDRFEVHPTIADLPDWLKTLYRLSQPT